MPTGFGVEYILYMEVVRAFIAVDLSPEIEHSLEQVSAQLQQRLRGIPVRWVPPKNMHLTFKFLGDVSISNIDLLKEILQSEAEKHPQFEISVGELGAFPSIHRPRVIWIGVKSPPILGDIQHDIDQRTARLGYAPEERKFTPHLTLGRVVRNASSEDTHKIGEVLSAYAVGFLGAARIAAIHLYRSDLSPQGAQYTRLFSAPLKNPETS